MDSIHVTTLVRTRYGRLENSGKWYSAYIEKAKQDGILFDSDNLQPSEQITRVQAALILTRYIEKYNPRWAITRVDNSPNDIDSVLWNLADEDYFPLETIIR